jgi:hypothetical protein
LRRELGGRHDCVPRCLLVLEHGHHEHVGHGTIFSRPSGDGSSPVTSDDASS